MNARTNLGHRSNFLGAGLLLAALTIAEGAQAMVTYEPAPAGSPWGCCGVIFAANGVRHQTEPFRWANGVWTNGGFASLVSDCDGGLGNSLNINNVNVRISLGDLVGAPGGPGVRKVEFWYQECGGNVNLTVNGHHVWWHDDFDDIPANEYAPFGAHLTVNVVGGGGCQEGWVTIEALPGACIEELIIGGQELCIDDIRAEEECGADCPADFNGDGTTGVTDLLQLIGAWGNPGGPEDLDGDGTVGAGDLLILLGQWGAC